MIHSNERNHVPLNCAPLTAVEKRCIFGLQRIVADAFSKLCVLSLNH